MKVLKTKEGIHRNHFNKRANLKICKTCGARQPRIRNQIRFISISLVLWLKVWFQMRAWEMNLRWKEMRALQPEISVNLHDRKDLRSQHFLAFWKCENDVKRMWKKLNAFRKFFGTFDLRLRLEAIKNVSLSESSVSRNLCRLLLSSAVSYMDCNKWHLVPTSADDSFFLPVIYVHRYQQQKSFLKPFMVSRN